MAGRLRRSREGVAFHPLALRRPRGTPPASTGNPLAGGGPGEQSVAAQNPRSFIGMTRIGCEYSAAKLSGVIWMLAIPAAYLAM